MPKHQVPDEVSTFKTMREQLQLSQEHAAHLLGVTLMTVSRWERGLFQIPPEAFLLSAIAKAKPPLPCAEGRRIGFDTGKLAAHAPGCKQCRDSVTYIHWAAKRVSS